MQEFNRRGNAPKTVTVETNATKTITKELLNYINDEFVEYGMSRWHWSMSPKLFTVSGEKDAVNDEVIFSYVKDSAASSILKFVCNGTPECWTELEDHVNRIQRKLHADDYWPPEVWVMPVGATKDQQEDVQVAEIAMEAMKRGYMVATRNHCYVFGNVIGK
jgi:hypothetical protein